MTTKTWQVLKVDGHYYVAGMPSEFTTESIGVMLLARDYECRLMVKSPGLRGRE